MNNRDELLRTAKPILFNGEMVRAILDGRKTVTRRVVRLKYSNTHHQMRTDKYGTRLIEIENDVPGVTSGKNDDGSSWQKIRGYIEPKVPYKVRDILYVRETWLKADDGYHYQADETDASKELCVAYGYKWRPSIHMPKEASRIFLKVKAVYPSQLQTMVEGDAKCEGLINDISLPGGTGSSALKKFSVLWDQTVSKDNFNIYGWDANPWVWAIEFEKIAGWE